MRVTTLFLALSLGCASSPGSRVVVRQFPLERVESQSRLATAGCEDDEWVVQGADGRMWAAEAGSTRPTRRCGDGKAAETLGPVAVDVLVAGN